MILEMGEELPILKGILNGVVKYHNARTFSHIKNNNFTFFLFSTCKLNPKAKKSLKSLWMTIQSHKIIPDCD